MDASLGEQRARIEHEIVAALCEAHADAVGAHDSQGSQARDTFGTTMWVRQHEILNERLRAVPGIVFRKPAGEHSRYEYPIVESTNTVIVPLMFSSDQRFRHDDVHRIKPSRLRLALLDGFAPPAQPDLFDAISDEDYEASYLEAVHAHEQLESAGRTLVVAFGRTPTGIFELGLAEVVVDDRDKGEISWRRWHKLPVYADVESIPVPPQLRVVEPPAADERFDAADDHADDELGYRLRETRQPGAAGEGPTP
ncbi:hypothetical protein KDN32_03755 [Nocardioides sp. J2M5]|uniref:hypothetical protein n=1 Tax=Nocardioides palaemonis TaxID=2829810 RepID=UPI001BA5B3FD|nr:hypothetical protein [Nocardioides palaemonis]MBS2936857.1 hypothetical protein [Nocardioides palaemonis]